LAPRDEELAVKGEKKIKLKECAAAAEKKEEGPEKAPGNNHDKDPGPVKAKDSDAYIRKKKEGNTSERRKALHPDVKGKGVTKEGSICEPIRRGGFPILKWNSDGRN